MSVQTRPDISYTLSEISGKLSATVADVLVLNKTVRQLHFSGATLYFPNLGSPDDWRIVMYSDASLNKHADVEKKGVYVVFLINCVRNRSALISWRSQKLKRIVRSTLSVECMACIEGIDTAFLLQQILNEILSQRGPILALTDSYTLVSSVYSAKTVTTSVWSSRGRVGWAHLS